ncbi:uncharacterized protein LOC116181613 [Photinus pyralis]|uniref:uncharacterized protein LOC116181613 n=1 Tax=Photinus pyralis TaxID=7054 RepID=UPI00126760CE|nr:uncharacterized protein LOC116181613 [Photinus pyralis]
MPEISQDKFESENPAMAMHTGAITSFDSIRGRTNSTEKGALALRSRANSSGRLKNVSFPPKIQRLSSCVSENDFESYMEGIHMQEPSWVDDRELAHRIFVNRSLHLENIKFYGFDMDYTLAGKAAELTQIFSLS